MRRTCLLTFLIAAPALSGAAARELAIPPVQYPALPVSGGAAEDFLPEGWVIDRRAAGDLNRDGRPDLALVLRMQEPRNIIAHDGLGENPLDTNPRILAVAFATPDGRYRRVVANHRLIPRRDLPTQADPLHEADTEFAISRGALRVVLYRFMNAGGWDMGPTAFTFRWQDGAMRLIGFDVTNVKRNTGCVGTLSANYLTRRLKTVLTHISIEREAVHWRSLPRAPLTTLDEVGNGFEFEERGLVEALPWDCHAAGLAPDGEDE